MQDKTVVGEGQEGSPIRFRHPLIQSSFMFLGELCCLGFHLLVSIISSDDQNPLLSTVRVVQKIFLNFALPALCDCAASVFLNLGLYYVSASVFQMLRGTLVIFAGIFTTILLKKSLKAHNWIGIVMITAGAAVVGVSTMVHGNTSASSDKELVGILMIIMAQVLNALQFIIEENYMKTVRPPVLVAVGVEGITGLCCCLAALPFVNTIQAPDGKPVDRVGQGIVEILGNPFLQITSIMIIASVATFNFCGISVTRELSGAARAAIDASRTALIWVCGIHIGWERFSALQAIGFGVIIAGTSVYNDVLRSCLPEDLDAKIQDLIDPLLSQPSGDWSSIASGDDYASTWESVDANGRAWGHTTGPIRAARLPNHATMARSITILPGALSPHSLASPIPADMYQSVASDEDDTIRIA